MIDFEFMGQRFVVTDDVVKIARVVLPNKTLLEATFWEEMDPPRIKYLAIIVQVTSQLLLGASVASCARPLKYGEFAFLQKGDKVIYAAGANACHVEAEAEVIEDSDVSVRLLVSRMIVISAVNRYAVRVGKEVLAGPREVFRCQ